MAALDAFEATQDRAWLDWALALARRTWRDHAAPDGALEDLARGTDREGLLSAPIRPVDDAPTPSPNGVGALLALRLAAHTGDTEWHQRAGQIVTLFGPESAATPLHRATLLLAAAWMLDDVTHLVIVGPRHDQTAGAMHRAAVASSVPHRTVRWMSPGDSRIGLPESLTLLLDATPAGATTGFCCTGTRCRAPVSTLEEWQDLLTELASIGALHGHS
jgi:uncharacterized protein YyaL (SSP411 family)